MATQLAKRELEKKRIDDAQRFERKDPNFRDVHQKQDIRRFEEAAYRTAAHPLQKVTYYQELARFYMWAQTDEMIFIVSHVPTGTGDKECVFDCEGLDVTLKASEIALPIICRTLDGAIDHSKPIETFRTPDNLQYAITLPKADFGAHWPRVFAGDSDGARCLQQPAIISENENDVTLLFKLPFWIEEDDVVVNITDETLSVQVRNELDFKRTYWRNSHEEETCSQYRVVDTAESLQFLDAETDASGKRLQELTVILSRPGLTESETVWKKGKRSDNRSAQSSRHSSNQPGVRFFVEDGDEFALEDLLQVSSLVEDAVLRMRTIEVVIWTATVLYRIIRIL